MVVTILLMDGYPGFVRSIAELNCVRRRIRRYGFSFSLSIINFWTSPNPSYMLSSFASIVCPIRDYFHNSLYGGALLDSSLSIT